jgi:hypothetical protein
VPANTDPIFVLTPVLKHAQIATANTNRDGTGTLGTVCAAGSNGTRIDRVVVQATVTTTAGMVRLFVDDGTNIRLLDEIPIAAVTPSGTVQAFRTERVRTDNLPYVTLANGETLKAGTNNAETFNVFAIGGDY